VGGDRGLEPLARARVDRRDQLAVDLHVGRAVERLQVAAVQAVLEEVDHREVDRVCRRVAAQLRDPPVERPVQLHVRARVVGPALHRVQDRLERPDVVVGVVSGGVAADQRLERVAHGHAVAVAGRAPRPGQPVALERHAHGGARHEHAAARPRAGLDEPAGLEQPHRLVHRRDGDAEALAQLLLGAQALAGHDAVPEDLGLDVTGDGLRARYARLGQAGGLRGGCHRDGSYARSTPVWTDGWRAGRRPAAHRSR
jgi:hypothetical protein